MVAAILRQALRQSTDTQLNGHLMGSISYPPTTLCDITCIIKLVTWLNLTLKYRWTYARLSVGSIEGLTSIRTTGCGWFLHQNNQRWWCMANYLWSTIIFHNAGNLNKNNYLPNIKISYSKLFSLIFKSQHQITIPNSSTGITLDTFGLITFVEESCWIGIFV